jgi:hypothetical protein
MNPQQSVNLQSLNRRFLIRRLLPIADPEIVGLAANTMAPTANPTIGNR